VQAYVDHRAGGAALPAQFVDWLLARSGGNPLSLVALLDMLVARCVLRVDEHGVTLAADYDQTEIPAALREMLDARLDSLAASDRRLLEGAAIAGCEFGSTAVATALDDDPIDVDEALRDLTRRGHLIGVRTTGGRDAAIDSRYAFASAMHHESVIDRIAPGRAAQMQARVDRHLGSAVGYRAPRTPRTLDGGFTQRRTTAAARRTLRPVKPS
jgi:predicted ATPase